MVGLPGISIPGNSIPDISIHGSAALRASLVPPEQAGEPGLVLPRAKREIRPPRDSPTITCPAALGGSGGEGWHSNVTHPRSIHALCRWHGKRAGSTGSTGAPPGPSPALANGLGRGLAASPVTVQDGDKDGEPMAPQPRGFSLAFCQVESGSGHFRLGVREGRKKPRLRLLAIGDTRTGN